MIRVNLLGEDRKKKRRVLPTKISMPRMESGSPLPLILVLIVFLATFGYLALRYLSLTKDYEQLSQDVARAEEAKREMTRLLKEIEQFDQKKRLLESRLRVIESLKKMRRGPVQILDSISNTVEQTNSVWLTALGQSGDKITVEGVATTLSGVANFVSNLRRTGVFKTVTVNETYHDVVQGIDGYVFSVSCEIPKAATTPS